MRTEIEINIWNILTIFLMLSINILAQEMAGPLPIYETTLEPNKIYQQGEIVLLGEDNDIRIYTSSNHQTENSIAINPTNPNNILVSTNGRIIYNGPNFVTVHQTYFYSTDGGLSWAGSEDSPNGIYTRGDPVAFFDDYGDAYYVTLAKTGGIYVLKSTDGGASWGDTVNADPLYSEDADKEHAAADISGTNPDNIYVAWTDFDGFDNPVVLTRSTDSGSSFGDRIELYSGSDLGQGTNIAIGPDGEVYVAFVNYEHGLLPARGIRFTKSLDGGESFPTANVAFAISGIRLLFNSGQLEFNNTRVNSFPSMDVDRSAGPRRGWIYIVYADRNTGDADIYLRRSEDDGESWSSAIRVNCDPVYNEKQQWFSSIAVDQVTGIIYVSYYNMDSDGYLTARYLARSEDGGTTFVCKSISDVRFTPTPLGGVHSPGYMGDYYETAAHNYRVYPTWSDDRTGNFQAYLSPLITTTVHQFLSDNVTEIGNIGYWNGSQFFDDPAPVNYDLSVGLEATTTLRGSQSIFSNEKYNQWFIDSNPEDNVENHHVFPTDGSFSSLTSQFIQTYSGITIKNSLESTETTGGELEFKDPWFIDYQDPGYANQLRNRGMDEAEWRTRLSEPFNPDYYTVFDNYPDPNQSYKGVFLDQDPNFLPDIPNYSVKVDQTQPINLGGSYGIRDFFFLNWSAEPSSGANFQDANALETGVVFTDEDAVVNANLKGNLLSNSTSGISSNSQRKLVRTDDGIFHLVYESLDQVWYTHSLTSNFQDSWSTEISLSREYDYEQAKNPSIDYYGNNLAVVFEAEHFSGVKKVICLRFDGSSWGSPEDITDIEQGYFGNAKPVVAYTPNELFACYRNSALGGLKYSYRHLQDVFWSTEILVPGTVVNSVNPSIA